MGASFLFALNPGVTELHFDDLGYATEALTSYETFKQLRADGVIPDGVRFQVCLPATGSAVSYFFSEPDEWPIIHAAYHEAIGREIEKILEVVPAEDLQIQFDFAMEFVDLPPATASASATGRMKPSTRRSSATPPRSAR